MENPCTCGEVCTSYRGCCINESVIQCNIRPLNQQMNLNSSFAFEYMIESHVTKQPVCFWITRKQHHSRPRFQSVSVQLFDWSTAEFDGQLSHQTKWIIQKKQTHHFSFLTKQDECKGILSWISYEFWSLYNNSNVICSNICMSAVFIWSPQLTYSCFWLHGQNN